MPTKPRLTGVDGLRGLAAVGVIVVHAWMYTGNRDPGQPALLDDVIGELRLGLTYFFVLSGFLLAGPWLRAAFDGRPAPRLGRYAAHRAARVLPAYWVALVGAFAVLYGTGHPRAVGAEALPVFAVFAQNQVAATAGQLNPPTWSLGVEVGFYALLPLAGWALIRARSRGRALTVCATLIAAGLAWGLVSQLERWPLTATMSALTYLPVFAAGIAAAVLAYERPPSRRVALALLAGGWALVVANGVWHHDGTGLSGKVLRDFPAAVGFAAIIPAVITRPGFVLDSAPVRWLGTVSYGTYLWHMPVLYWLVTRGLFPEDPLGACVAVLVPALALGALSWRVVERPVLRLAAQPRASAARPRSATAPRHDPRAITQPKSQPATTSVG